MLERRNCSVRVVSAERPAETRYSARVVRRNVPLMRMSNGVGVGRSSMAGELRICERL